MALVVRNKQGLYGLFETYPLMEEAHLEKVTRWLAGSEEGAPVLKAADHDLLTRFHAVASTLPLQVVERGWNPVRSIPCRVMHGFSASSTHQETALPVSIEEMEALWTRLRPLETMTRVPALLQKIKVTLWAVRYKSILKEAGRQQALGPFALVESDPHQALREIEGIALFHPKHGYFAVDSRWSNQLQDARVFLGEGAISRSVAVRNYASGPEIVRVKVHMAVTGLASEPAQDMGRMASVLAIVERDKLEQAAAAQDIQGLKDTLARLKATHPALFEEEATPLPRARL
jgi:hypothetical protein